MGKRRDVLTRQQRRYCMSRIRGRNTRPEVALRSALRAFGIHYRFGSHLPGRPDLVVSAARLAIFIDGCFWHQCPKHFVMPRTRHDFWRMKIERNTRRDRQVNEQLKQAGWKVIRVWEHDVKDRLPAACARIANVVKRSAISK